MMSKTSVGADWVKFRNSRMHCWKIVVMLIGRGCRML